MIIGFGGKLSGGKTVRSVGLAYNMALKSGKRIISNIDLNMPSSIDVIKLSPEKFIDFLKANYENSLLLKDTFSDSILLFDEIANYVSSRKSTTMLNELIVEFFMMLGKLNAHLIYTAQVFESQTDKILRNCTNIYANCYRFTKDGPVDFEKDRKINEKVYILVMYEYDYDILGIKVIPEVFDPEPYFNMYNTEEFVLLDRSKYLRGGVKDLRKR